MDTDTRVPTQRVPAPSTEDLSRALKLERLLAPYAFTGTFADYSEETLRAFARLTLTPGRAA